MRTRRSPRNQEILFRELFKPKDEPKQPLEPEPWTGNEPHLFGLSPKRKAQFIRQRQQEIARWRIRNASK